MPSHRAHQTEVDAADINRLSIYATLVACFGALFSLIAFLQHPSGAISQPYPVVLLIGPAYLVGRHLSVRWGTLLVSLVSIGLLFGVGWVQSRGASMMGWMVLPVLGHSLVSFRRDVAVVVVLSAGGALLLEHHFAELTEYANGVISILGLFSVLYASVYLFVKGRQGVVLRLQSSVRQLEEVSELRRQAELRARAAEARQAEFLALMSHEIRTPLHGIVGLSQLISQGESGEDQQAHLDALGASSQVLLSLLNDVLDLAKLDAGELVISPRPTAVRALFDRILDTYKGSVSASEVKLELDVALAVPSGLELDEARVTEVVGNLISNAAKFTARGLIRVKVNWEEEHLGIQVQDSGSGIPPEHLPGIFDRYSKGKDGRQRGTGLGLALVRELVLAMDGQIQVKSVLGEGSTFCVRIPTRVARVSTHAKRRERMDGLHILLVDDSDVNLMVGQSLFESRGAQVTLADGGPGALGMLREGLVPDVVVTDLHMPGMDGLALLEEIRSAEFGHDLPVVAFSAAVGGERQRALDAGMQAFLPKPVDLDSACRTLKELAA